MKNLILLLTAISLLANCSYPELPLAEIKKLATGDTTTTVVKGVSLKFNSYSVYSDNNGDKKINKGETVSLRVSLKNVGTSAAKAVKATFSTNSSYVSGFTPTTQVSYGTISAGSSVSVRYDGTNYSGYTIRFAVSNTAPAGTQIPISISMEDESGNTWADSFSVTVDATGAQMAYNSYSVYSDNNSDGIINKGETVGLRVSLKNVGTSTANAVKATFSTNSSYVSGFTPTSQVSYGTISAGSSVSVRYDGSNYSGYTIRFAVSNTAPAGTQIPISISMEDESYNTWTDNFYAIVGSENADIAYSSYTVVADNNGNKKVEKSETVYLQVFLRNNGSGAASSVKATFSTSSAYISGLEPATPIDYGNFTGGQSKYAQAGYDFGTYYTIKFTVSGTASTNMQLPININITDGSSNTWNSSFNVIVQ